MLLVAFVTFILFYFTHSDAGFAPSTDRKLWCSLPALLMSSSHNGIAPCTHTVHVNNIIKHSKQLYRRRLFFFLPRAKDKLPPLPSPSLPPFITRPPKYSYGVRGNAVSSPSGVWGEAYWCILESKRAALVAAVFVDFPKNKGNFLHKSS